MSPDPQPAPADPAKAIRTLVLALVGSVLALTVAVALAVPIDGTSPDPVTVGAALTIVVASALLARAVGFRVPALATSTTAQSPEDVERVALGRFQTSTILRFAVTEAGIIVVIALTFVIDEGPWPTLVAAPVGAVLLYLNCWPGRANVERVASALEADGVRSGLREAFGHA